MNMLRYVLLFSSAHLCCAGDIDQPAANTLQVRLDSVAQRLGLDIRLRERLKQNIHVLSAIRQDLLKSDVVLAVRVSFNWYIKECLHADQGPYSIMIPAVINYLLFKEIIDQEFPELL